MRAYEFITESFDPDDRENGLTLARRPLPYTYVIPELKNQDFYEIYRFGLALAAVRGEGGQEDGVQNLKYQEPFEAESAWGEHEVVTSFDPNIGKVIDSALKKIHKKGKKLVSTPTSQEPTDVYYTSPVKPFKGYKK
jgi:N-acyl-D-aspartate/D-glutamate deacylase